MPRVYPPRKQQLALPTLQPAVALDPWMFNNLLVTTYDSMVGIGSVAVYRCEHLAIPVKQYATIVAPHSYTSFTPDYPYFIPANGGLLVVVDFDAILQMTMRTPHGYTVIVRHNNQANVTYTHAAEANCDLTLSPNPPVTFRRKGG
jgi:hypothetical protein